MRVHSTGSIFDVPGELTAVGPHRVAAIFGDIGRPKPTDFTGKQPYPLKVTEAISGSERMEIGHRGTSNSSTDA